MLTAFAFYRQHDRHAYPKTVRDAFQTPNTGSARKAPAQCQVQQSRSNVNASANPLISCYSELKNKVQNQFWGYAKVFLFHGIQDMVHILDLVLEATMVFFLAMLAECVSSFVRLTTLILLPKCLLGDLWFLFYHESSA